MEFLFCSMVKFEKAEDKVFSETVGCRIMKAVRFLELTMFLEKLILEI